MGAESKVRFNVLRAVRELDEAMDAMLKETGGEAGRDFDPIERTIWDKMLIAHRALQGLFTPGWGCEHRVVDLSIDRTEDGRYGKSTCKCGAVFRAEYDDGGTLVALRRDR